jgi:hypothetical protein
VSAVVKGETNKTVLMLKFIVERQAVANLIGIASGCNKKRSTIKRISARALILQTS